MLLRIFSAVTSKLFWASISLLRQRQHDLHGENIVSLLNLNYTLMSCHNMLHGAQAETVRIGIVFHGDERSLFVLIRWPGAGVGYV